jgi:preprotein translocase subunit SecY
LPYFVSYWTNIPTGMALGGTGLIIMATATLEMWNSTVSNATTTGYNVHRQKIESKLSRQLAEEGGEVKTSEPTQMW